MIRKFSFIVRYNGQHYHTIPSVDNKLLLHTRELLRLLISEGLITEEKAEEQYHICQDHINLVRRRIVSEETIYNHTPELTRETRVILWLRFQNDYKYSQQFSLLLSPEQN